MKNRGWKKSIAKLSPFFVALFLMAPLAGCDRDEGPLEEAAEEIEDAAEELGDKVDG